MPELHVMTDYDGKPMPDIGDMIEKKMEEKGITKSALARKIGVFPGSITQYFKQRTMHAALIWKMGAALKFNFFTVLANEFPIETASEREKKLQEKIEELKKENELLIKILLAKSAGDEKK